MIATHWQPILRPNHLLRNMLLHDFANQSSRLAKNNYPPLNLSEDDDNFYVEAELPGFATDDLELHVAEGNQLSMKGARNRPEPQDASWHQQEKVYGEFHRTVELPAPVNPDEVSATFTNGVLTITLAKVEEETKQRKIAITSG